MSADGLLRRLDKVRKTGPDKWSARCPAHDDKGPSLAIKETDDGRTLLHCFAGCSVGEVVDALGMTLNDLFPPKPLTGDSFKPVRRQWSASDALIGIAFESLVLLQYANHLATGTALSDAGRARLQLSATRIRRAQETAQ